MPEGGRITIETENVLVNGEYTRTHPWARPGRYVILTVTDTGVGMDAEIRKHLFEPFFTTKEQGKGTGLGLATVYGIVQQHQGLLHVYSEVGKGSTFKVYLPVVERLAAEVGSKVDTAVPGGNETILVAEDEELVRAVVVRILSNAGYEVLVATNGLDAVRLFKQQAERIPLVILDVIMPKLNGPEAAALIRGARQDVRVLFTSGYTDAALSESDKLDLLLPKPFEPDKLLRTVRDLLDRPVATRS
jgi:CheY-like chemotaxis protein